MAEKHKSKYKAPKDLEKSQKLKARKDLKDYTEDDKKGALNPRSTGEKQSNVLRKTDKEFIDTGDIYVKYNADDRLYKDLEDGEYDPKHAAKVLKKRQDTDETDNKKNIKDKIENLTRESKERLVREYVRRKLVKILSEADDTKKETPTDIAPEAPAPPAPDAVAPEAPAPEAPAPDTPTAPASEAPASEAPASEAPTPEAPAPETNNQTPENQSTEFTQTVDYNAAGSQIASEKNTIYRVDAMGKIINTALKQLEPKKQESFLRMLKIHVINKYKNLDLNKRD